MLEQISSNKVHGGHIIKYKHYSTVLACDMKFNVFLPKETAEQKVPAIYFLSGLTCTEDNFMQKSGTMAEAANYGLALIAPDTSSRVSLPGDNDTWDFGQGASFYVDATVAPWSQHYCMYSYIVDELPALVNKYLPIEGDRVSIMGHSMGGHGALSIFLKNSSRYKSVSAFSPVVNPTQCPWGQKAFREYLGEDKSTWAHYDTVELLKKFNGKINALVDVGTSDNFLKEQLKIDTLRDTVQSLGKESEWTIRYQQGYDHSYYFITSFIADHIAHHAKALL
ncbi:S-formylglutathione hydrolase [Spinellus fusiger]|nr:S-formylglutathione hydrolase [Spinellus fusiger]